VVGPWVSYRVRTESRNAAPREYTQRVAIVGKDRYRGQDGFWVELKTEGSPSGKRIERGFFIIVDVAAEIKKSQAHEGELAELPADSLGIPAPPSVRLVRYQVLTSGGKLFEYPVSSASEPRAGSEVSTMELFEYDSSTPAAVQHLGPDTLRIGRRVVPTQVERTIRSGSDDWVVHGAGAHLNRPFLTQTFWRNGAVPITGFAKSLFEVTVERSPVPDSLAATQSSPADSSMSADRPDSAQGSAADSVGTGTPRMLTKTELTLLDLGADAVPEVTQTPEVATPPDTDSPGTAR
jgi:hypothetical protein